MRIRPTREQIVTAAIGAALALAIGAGQLAFAQGSPTNNPPPVSTDPPPTNNPAPPVDNPPPVQGGIRGCDGRCPDAPSFQDPGAPRPGVSITNSLGLPADIKVEQPSDDKNGNTLNGAPITGSGNGDLWTGKPKP